MRIYSSFNLFVDGVWFGSEQRTFTNNMSVQTVRALSFFFSDRITVP